MFVLRDMDFSWVNLRFIKFEIVETLARILYFFHFLMHYSDSCILFADKWLFLYSYLGGCC